MDGGVQAAPTPCLQPAWPLLLPFHLFGVKQWIQSGIPDGGTAGSPWGWALCITPGSAAAASWPCCVSAPVAVMLGGHFSSPSALISVGRGRQSCRGTPGVQRDPWCSAAPGRAGMHPEHGDTRMRKVRTASCSPLGALQRGTFPLAVPHRGPPSPWSPRGHPAPLNPHPAFRSRGSAENGVPLGEDRPFPHTPSRGQGHVSPRGCRDRAVPSAVAPPAPSQPGTRVAGVPGAAGSPPKARRPAKGRDLKADG